MNFQKNDKFYWQATMTIKYTIDKEFCMWTC